MINPPIAEEWREELKRDYASLVFSPKTLVLLEYFISQEKERSRREGMNQAVDYIKNHGAYTDNPIDQGPDAPPIDGSFYNIYAGELEAARNQ